MMNNEWLTNTHGEQADKVIDQYAALGAFLEANPLVKKDLQEYCGIKRSSFVKGDSHNMAFNEGGRDVYLHILEMTNLKGELSNE